MKSLDIYLDGVGLLGPGLNDWAHACEVLSGRQAYASAPTVLPVAHRLPPAERRRVGTAIKLTMAIGFEAALHAGADVAQLATVFSSSEGDCDNSVAILEALASSDRALSPTRFHNSVHNAPSGYWGIATTSMEPSTSINAYDATFAAGLLEAASQACSTGKPCLLLAYDTAFPAPLRQLRTIPDAMGIALLLNPLRSDAARALLRLRLCDSPASAPMTQALERLRQDIPVAQGLPLLALVAQERSGSVVVEYLDALRLRIEVTGVGT